MSGMGVGEMMLLSAAIGGGTSAAQGQDPLKGALLGALGGAASAGIGGLLSGAGAAGAGAGTIAGGSGLTASGLGAAGGAGAGAGALGAAGAGAGAGAGALGSGIATLPTTASALAPAAATAPLAVPAMTAPATAGLSSLAAPIQPGMQAIELASQAPQLGASSSAYSLLPPPSAQAQSLAQSFTPNYGLLPPQAGGAASPLTGAQASSTAAKSPGIFDDPKAWWKSLPPEKKLLYGGTGIGALALMGGRDKIPGQEPYTGPLSRFRYDPDVYVPSLPGPRFASGGIADLGGSDLGSYSDGGQLLAGDGDGMSDDIPASISGKQPARLADGEFVVPADVVSGLGNGSTDAGARELYSMMSRVRKQRTGTEKQGRRIEPRKVVPA